MLLTNYRFPSFFYVAFGQMLTTVILLFLLKQLRLLSFPRMDSSVPRKIFPLPILFVVNVITGLGATQRLSLPMFTVLRRFSILLTMLLEFIVLGEAPTFGVKLSVFLMVFGSAFAAVFDLSFDFFGYAFIFINNIATAANGVYTKKKLESKELGKSGLLFYNSLFMLIPLSAIIFFHTEDTEEVPQIVSDKSILVSSLFKKHKITTKRQVMWRGFFVVPENGYLTVSVLVVFVLSCLGGILLNYSAILCTSHNTALTTACVGTIKNIFVTYIGMFSSGDYVFSLTNFVGINVSVFGSVLYTYVTLRTNQSKVRQVTVLPAEKVALVV
uniref:Sugar phosphate transporter domain-containing protein n=1 Tax=Globodera rostochiensis TaxID=31243 RepID=A0A914HSW8_GLORO